MSFLFNTTKHKWSKAYEQIAFKKLLFSGIILLIITLGCYPYFFNMIEERQGIILNDFVLKALPSINLSIPIFVIIWGTSLLLIVACIKSPYIFINFLWSFIILSLSRIITISLVPLNAPQNLVPLIDPISNTFYGGKFLTKDLFYSGHTATQILIYYHLQKKWQKKLTLVASFLIGLMVLIQHVHYTVDVIFAFVFVPMIVIFTKKIILDKININLQQIDYQY